MTDGSLKLYIPPYLNHPRKAKNVLDTDPSILTRTQRVKVAVAEIVAAQEDHKYLGKHPEAKAIIRLILRQIFMDRPANIPEFVAAFVQRKEFPFEVSDLMAETTEGSQTSGSSDGGSSDSDSFEGLYNKMFAGLENLTHHGSMADARLSFAAAARSRSRSVLFQEQLKRSRSKELGRSRSKDLERSRSDVPERVGKSERRHSSVKSDRRNSSVKSDRRNSSVKSYRRNSSVKSDRRHSSMNSDRRRSSIPGRSHQSRERKRSSQWQSSHEEADASVQEQERRLSISIPAERERRRSTVGSERRHSVGDPSLAPATGEQPATGDDPAASVESETDEDDFSSSSSDSWSSEESLELSLGSDWDENERALFEGQTLIFAMLGKKLDSRVRDLDEGGSSSEESGAKLTERAVHAAFRASQDKDKAEEDSVAGQVSNADMRSLYTMDGGVSRVSTLDEITQEEDEEYFD